MEPTSTISKLNSYKQLVHQNALNDFIDFVYSQRIINEFDYQNIYQYKSKVSKLHELFKIIETKTESVEKVLIYLDKVYPNNKKLLDDEYNFRISSVRGGFPKLPPNYIERTSLAEDLKAKLLSLEWDQKLVVHGMMGYGKSCLVNEVLNDINIRKCFDNFLFWINLGEHHGKETVLKPLWKLYTTASGIVNNKILHCPDDVQVLKDMLIELFLDARLINALIILDDASSEEVLSYFNIRCKTVITTQNKKILASNEGIFVEVKTGFSRVESSELFKKSLKVTHDLPAAAEEIHDLCKGHPMLIALVGSYLSDNSEMVINNDNEIWEGIRVMFLHRKYNLKESDNSEVPTVKIESCIEKLLTNGLKSYYEDLAIFLPDVNIPPEVLEILWNQSRFEVINKMNKYAEKSLVVPFYHKDLKTYIYGIHDIHLNYLKDVTKERTVSLHRKLISAYDRITNGNYANLPNDNYTLQFIGYHLYEAEEFKKFNIYFDFKFLEAKIKAVGKEDVLKDMSKYEIYITKQENMLKHRLEQYKDFISRCGSSLYSNEKTDIVQFALREAKESVVFRDALALAEKSQNLYFQLQRPADNLDYSIRNIRDDITCACFVDSPQHILIGTANGKIKLFFEEYDKEISSFEGHTGYIKKLIVSPDKKYLLSVSIDGKVILWKFALDSARNSYDFSNQLPVSPKIKQKLWQDIYTPDRGKVKPTRVFQLNESDDFLISATFCDNFPETYRIATGSLRGRVIIWDAYNGDQLDFLGVRGYKVPCIIYQETERKLIYSCEENILVYTIDDKLTYLQTLHNSEICESIFISNNKIIAVGDKNITLWDERKPKKLFEKVDTNKHYICSAVTDDTNYLIVSTDKGIVFVWDFEENKMLKEIKSKGLAKSLDTFYDEDRSVHILLIGSDQKTLQQCHILPSDNEPHIVTTPKFIPFWKKKHALTALVNEDNQIVVFSGYVHFAETNIIESPVTCTCFSTCGYYVVYGLQNGEIHIFNFRSKKTMCLESNALSNRGAITYLYCHKLDNVRHESVSSYESNDSMNFNFSFEGVIISVSNNNLITVYNKDIISSNEVMNPLIFYKENSMIVVDVNCSIYAWNLLTNSFTLLNNPGIFERVKVFQAAFCSEKSLLALIYKQMDTYFLDVCSLWVDEKLAKLLTRLELEDEVKSCCFSFDGSLLALGMSSGDIKVYNLNQKYKSVTLSLHNYPVENLLFSPSIQPPILVSLGENIAWWNLAKFLEEPRKRGRPKSIDILDVSNDFASMNISHWSDRKYVDGVNYLLSCMKLSGCAKYLSASNDFNTFLTVDDEGKIYVMEIISSNK